MTYFNARGMAMPESAPEQARVAGTAAGNETITAAPGASSLSGEGGGDVLIGNSSDNRHWITHPKDRVVEQAGGGVDTMIAWTDMRLADNVENLIVNGNYNYAVGNGLGNLIVVDDNTHWIYGRRRRRRDGGRADAEDHLRGSGRRRFRRDLQLERQQPAPASRLRHQHRRPAPIDHEPAGQ
ncbi:hypothetical protein [Phenylobacterium sp. J367]|uniref:hypothetical protein n=1 Tax=Phenylobacterium sp. J367 TaxID=2898435 RepID=UPI0021519AEF|nr:hypothetical protein [Phenylobacterium sp. J367]MCR5880875.1 hypothetical protein [Phenylobacterium sp. J367]